MSTRTIEAAQLRPGDHLRLRWTDDKPVIVKKVARSWHKGLGEWVTLVRFVGGGSFRLIPSVRLEVER